MVGSVLSIFFLSLICFNYLSAQKAISEEKTSTTTVEVTSRPKTVEVGDRAAVDWYVEVPDGQVTAATTIYWGYESSPSALLFFDSPQAVGYPNHPGDYESGDFPLPSTFTVSITPDTVGMVYFRSYALVRGNHLWSEEKSFLVTPKTNEK